MRKYEFNQDNLNFQELVEFRGVMIDQFEDFCETSGIDIANNEKLDSDCPSHIYGADYDRIAAPIEQYVLGEISKEQIAVRMTKEFLAILCERGCFTGLNDRLEETISLWTSNRERKESA